MSAPKRIEGWPGGLRIALIALVSLGATVFWAASQRASVARCPTGLHAQGTRCCPEGQHVTQSGTCDGIATACSMAQLLKHGACTAVQAKIRFGPGQLTVAPNDWEAQGKISAHSIVVNAFALDRTEVSVAEWQKCVRAGTCRKLPAAEPGLPVNSVTAAEAGAYCRSVGGRLPTSDEWLFAASGEQARRYPWGQTGLVCRRAVFGLEHGPCGTGATGPDLVGARPDGATPEGLLDMAGNVAEWTRGAAGFEVRGGSFRSQLAGELKVWRAAPAPQGGATQNAEIGFRCAYDE